MKYKVGDKIRVVKKYYSTVDIGYVGECVWVGKTPNGEDLIDVYFEKNDQGIRITLSFLLDEIEKVEDEK